MKSINQKFAVFLIAICILIALPVLATEIVNINTAGIEALSTLKGISKVRAEGIVKYREANGPYQSIEDLKNVRGIGDKIIEKNQSAIVIESIQADEDEILKNRD